MATTSRSTGSSSGCPPVRVTRLSKKLGDHTIWADQTFTVEAGSSLAITGPSGAGKSSLLNCIALLDLPDAGSIELDGTPISGISRLEKQNIFRHTLGHLFQNYGLVESWSVDRNLDVAFAGRRVTRLERTEERRSVLVRVGLDGVGSRRASSLSGGEQQRVALARLLLKKPLIVVADEPSAALDDLNVTMVLSVLNELREGGSAIVIATHDDAVAEWCGRRLHLSRAGEATSADPRETGP